MKLLNYILITALISLGTIRAQDDLHSSVTALETVFHTEKIYMENLENYIFKVQKKLAFFKSKLNEYKNDHKILVQNSTKALQPIKQLSFTKQLTRNFLKTIRTEFSTSEFSQNITRYQSVYHFPTSIDLEGVTHGLLRLQNVYNYSATVIANGSFLKVKNKAQLYAWDCFEIGLSLFAMKKNVEAEEWFQEAYNRYGDKDQHTNLMIKPVKLAAIMDFLAYTKYVNGDEKKVRDAIIIAKQILAIDPTFGNVAIQLPMYEQKLRDLKFLFKDESITVDYVQELKNYHSGCRGEFKKTPEELRKLYCRYQTETHPFLKLAPLKVEIQNWEPYVAIFYDILYDNEIEIIKNLSTSQLTRATVWSSEEGKPTLSLVRTSKFMFIGTDMHPLMQTIDQRLTDMTGLSMETAESLQVMNYGIGGHYDVHPDYFLEPDEQPNVQPYGYFENGNRIATVLFYMSDVEQGGATVYPNIKTAVFPTKATAVFWYSLFPNGRGDPRSRHAACPVIFGSKWVCNKWIRIRGQEFIRPCKLQPYGH